VALLAAFPGQPGEADGRSRLRSIGLWASGFAVASVAVFLATVDLGEAGQLVRPHVQAWRADGVDRYGRRFLEYLRGDYAIVLLGVVGLAALIHRRARVALLPAVWTGVAAAVLLGHKPLWYHHYLLVSIPICWAAGMAAGSLLERRFSRSRWSKPDGGSRFDLAADVVTLGLLLVVVRTLPGFLERNFADPLSWPRDQDRYLVAVMEALKDETNLVVTDRQMLAFRAGLGVPPPLSVTSLKRILSGHLSTDRLVSMLESYRPEQVVLSGRRIPLTPGLLGYVDEHYTMIYGNEASLRYYVSKDLAGAVLPALQQGTATVPECWQGHLNLGYLLADLGRDREAVGAYREALARLPRNPAYAAVRRRLERLSGSVALAD
jgi:hypothetical protein